MSGTQRPLRHPKGRGHVDNSLMSHPGNDPNHRPSDPLERGSEGCESIHDQDLVGWLTSKGVRSPDWCIDPCVFDQVERQLTGESNPFRLSGEAVVSGVYLFYSWNQDEIVPLYVGKAANLWNRMQTHWCRPGERGWINSYIEDINRSTLDDVVMACAWKEEERAGVEARLIKILKPRYCRRME